MTPPEAPPHTTTALLVMGDFADERCGVGSSDSIVVGVLDVPVPVLDPTSVSLGEFWREVRAAAHDREGAVLVYPTQSQVRRPDLIAKALVVRSVMGRRWVRLHLHEFDQLDRRQRAGVALVAGLTADRIIVSSIGEAAALRARYRGWAARRAEVVVVPPANASVPTSADLDRADAAGAALTGRVLGLHGQYRPDKGIDWLIATLRVIDRRFDRLEIAGRGWAAAPWPRSVLDRLEVVDLGQVDRSALPEIFQRWDLALAPFDSAPTDGRLSLRTPLAFGVPTLTRGPRPSGLRLGPPHLLFHDEVALGELAPFTVERRRAGAAEVAEFEATVRGQLADAMFGS